MDIRKLLIPDAQSIQKELKVLKHGSLKPTRVIKDKYGHITKVRRVRISDNAYREYYY
nr:MAG TPA: hypothetical protein [Caudoviricetes sp.]